MNDQFIGIAAGTCTSISLVPQLIKTIKDKKAGEISWFMLVILMIGIAFWIWYGLIKKDLPIIITKARPHARVITEGIAADPIRRFDCRNDCAGFGRQSSSGN